MTPRVTRHLKIEDLRGLRWRGYLRESSQAQAEMWSPERQRTDLARAATELGLTGDGLLYERTGTGEAASDELDRALADAGQYDVLLVLTTSRFARNVTESRRRKAQFAKAGIPIYFVADRILSGTRSSRLLEGFREVMDEEGNEERRFWIAGGHRQRQLSGRWLGSIPYGYRETMADFPDGSRRWDGRLEPDPVAAPVVRRIFAAFVAGVTPKVIAFDLNAEGLGVWRRGKVVKLLANPVYTGSLVRYREHRAGHYYPEADPLDGRTVIEGGVPAIVNSSLWASADRLRRERRINDRPVRWIRYPLSSVLRCGACNGRMSGMTSGGRRYYRCSTRAETGACDAPHGRAERIERAFADWLDTLRLPADWRKRLASLPDRDRDTEAERRKRLGERLERLKHLYSWGDLSEAEYRRESTEIRSELAVVARPNLGNMTAIAEALESLGRTWLADTSPARSVIPSLMLREMVVEHGTVAGLVARPEMAPIVELCAGPRGPRPQTEDQPYVRFSA